jgi:hypothetical protein
MCQKTHAVSNDARGVKRRAKRRAKRRGEGRPLSSQQFVALMANPSRFITVTAGMCDPVRPNDPQLCNLVAGASDYFNYKWSDDNHYVTSRDVRHTSRDRPPF